MGTRSRIGIQSKKDGSVRSIYCHWDGYVDGGVGDGLRTHYQDREKIQKLMDFGDRSSLEATPSMEDSYADRGEDCPAQLSADVQGFLNIEWGEEYYYLFTADDEWLWWPVGYKLLEDGKTLSVGSRADLCEQALKKLSADEIDALCEVHGVNLREP